MAYDCKTEFEVKQTALHLDCDVTKVVYNWPKKPEQVWYLHHRDLVCKMQANYDFKGLEQRFIDFCNWYFNLLKANEKD